MDWTPLGYLNSCKLFHRLQCDFGLYRNRNHPLSFRTILGSTCWGSCELLCIMLWWKGASPYLLAPLLHGQVIKPGLVLQHAICRAAHQLWSQHSPRQSQVQDWLHCRCPVAERDPSWKEKGEPLQPLRGGQLKAHEGKVKSPERYAYPVYHVADSNSVISPWHAQALQYRKKRYMAVQTSAAAGTSALAAPPQPQQAFDHRKKSGPWGCKHLNDGKTLTLDISL